MEPHEYVNCSWTSGLASRTVPNEEPPRSRSLKGNGFFKLLIGQDELDVRSQIRTSNYTSSSVQERERASSTCHFVRLVDEIYY